jgi:hypothetical protein
MTAWAVWSILKHLAVAALAAGLLGAALLRDEEDRQRAVYALATPGFLGAWIAGYGLLRETGVSMGAPWISASLITSLGALAAAAWSVEAPRRAGAWVAVALFAATVAVMVLRPGAA